MRYPMLVIAAAALTASTVFAQPTTLPVEDWSRHPVGQRGLPTGWQAQSWGSPKYQFAIEARGHAHLLPQKSQNDGSTMSKEIKFDIRQFPILQWRWRATVLPKGGDSRKKATDDQACQLYVTFPRTPQAIRSRNIGYVWDTTAPAGTIAPSEKTGTVTYVIVRSPAAHRLPQQRLGGGPHAPRRHHRAQREDGHGDLRDRALGRGRPESVGNGDSKRARGLQEDLKPGSGRDRGRGVGAH